MKLVYQTVLVLAFIAVAGVTFGYAFEAGGKITPARLRLAEAMKASDEASDRLNATLKELIGSHCTWARK